MKKIRKQLQLAGATLLAAATCLAAGCSQLHTTGMPSLFAKQPALEKPAELNADPYESFEPAPGYATPKSAIAGRNLKLAPANEYSQQEIEALNLGKQAPKTESQPADNRIADDPTGERIIVIAAQNADPQRGSKRNPKSAKRRTIPRVVNRSPADNTLNPIAKTPPVNPVPRLHQVKPIPRPKTKILAQTLQPNSTTNSTTNSNTWPSETAGQFEQPADSLIGIVVNRGGESYLKPLDNPITSKKFFPENTPNHDPAIQLVTHTEEIANDRSSSEKAPSDIAPLSPTGDHVPAVTPWKDQLGNLVATLEAQTTAANFETLPAESQSQITMSLELMRALQAIPNRDTTTAAQQSEWSRKQAAVLRELLPALIQTETGIDATADASQIKSTLQRLNTAVATLSNVSDLQLLNASFCTRIKGYGQVTQAKNSRFRAGQRLLVYCEVENFVSHQLDSDTKFETRLLGTYSIYNDKHEVVQTVEFPEVVDAANTRRRDFFIHLPVTIEELPSGNYTLQVNVIDLGGQKSAQLPTALEFTIEK